MMTERIISGLDDAVIATLNRWNINSVDLLKHFTRSELVAVGLSTEAVEDIAVYLMRRCQLAEHPMNVQLAGREVYGSYWEVPIQVAFVQLNWWQNGDVAEEMVTGMNRLLADGVTTLGALRLCPLGDLTAALGHSLALRLSGWMSGAGLTPG